MRRRVPAGSTETFPLSTRYRSLSNSQDIIDEIYRANPQGRVDEFYDFCGAPKKIFEDCPLFWNDTTLGINRILTTDTKVARYYAIAPRSGIILGAKFVGEAALAANDTNYLTFAITNRIMGAGSTAVLAATDPNTTKATGGSAIAAKTARTLTLNATAANLYVTKGDTLEITATVAGTLANVIDSPMVQLEYATIPEPLAILSGRVAGRITAIPGNFAGGGYQFAVQATSEAQYAGFYLDDYLNIQANRGFFVEMAVTPTAAPAANQRFAFGLISAFNATLDNIVSNLQFRADGSSALVVEGDDGTTDTDDQAATSAVATVGTSKLILGIDGRDLSAVRFLVNGQSAGTVAVSAMGSALLQPYGVVQKDSGTGVPGFTVDYVRIVGDRV